MGTCPRCGNRIKRKNKSLNVRICPKHGPIEHVFDQQRLAALSNQEEKQNE